MEATTQGGVQGGDRSHDESASLVVSFICLNALVASQ